MRVLLMSRQMLSADLPTALFNGDYPVAGIRGTTVHCNRKAPLLGSPRPSRPGLAALEMEQQQTYVTCKAMSGQALILTPSISAQIQFPRARLPSAV
jgi:hypothetical protein